MHAYPDDIINHVISSLIGTQRLLRILMLRMDSVGGLTRHKSNTVSTIKPDRKNSYKMIKAAPRRSFKEETISPLLRGSPSAQIRNVPRRVNAVND